MHKVKLGDVCESCLGKMLDAQKNKGEYHYYLANINVRWGSFELSDLPQMKFESHEHERYGIKKGDLIVCEGGEPGRCAVWEEEIPNMKIQKALHRVRPFECLNVYYLYYWFVIANKQNTLKRNFIQTTIKHLTGVQLKELEINLPNIDRQVEIVDVLQSLDKKIACNNRINTELENMAKTLYGYWFVQYDFPDANGKPYKSSNGKMIYNKELKREIPEAWEVKKLGEVEPNIITGKTPPTSRDDFYGEDIPFITIGDIRGNTYITNTEQYLSVLGAQHQEKKYLPEDSICVSCIATVGLVGFTTEKSQTNQQVNSIICKESENLFYLYFTLKNYFCFAQRAKTGATFANMNKQEFSAINVLVPSCENTKQQFYETVKPMFDKIKCLSFENQQLAKLRDWLLPMLMNGQVTANI